MPSTQSLGVSQPFLDALSPNNERRQPLTPLDTGVKSADQWEPLQKYRVKDEPMQSSQHSHFDPQTTTSNNWGNTGQSPPVEPGLNHVPVEEAQSDTDQFETYASPIPLNDEAQDLSVDNHQSTATPTPEPQDESLQKAGLDFSNDSPPEEPEEPKTLNDFMNTAWEDHQQTKQTVNPFGKASDFLGTTKSKSQSTVPVFTARPGVTKRILQAMDERWR